MYLFDMEEVFSLEGDGHAWQRDVIVVAGAVVDICANSKCNWFGLPRGTKDKIDEISDCAKKKYIHYKYKVCPSAYLEKTHTTQS